MKRRSAVPDVERNPSGLAKKACPRKSTQCRLCLRVLPKKELLEIFSQNSTLKDTIQCAVGIEVSRKDHSHRICLCCVELVRMINDFSTTCERTAQMFTQRVELSNENFWTDEFDQKIFGRCRVLVAQYKSEVDKIFEQKALTKEDGGRENSPEIHTEEKLTVISRNPTERPLPTLPRKSLRKQLPQSPLEDHLQGSPEQFLTIVPANSSQEGKLPIRERIYIQEGEEEEEQPGGEIQTTCLKIELENEDEWEEVENIASGSEINGNVSESESNLDDIELKTELPTEEIYIENVDNVLTALESAEQEKDYDHQTLPVKRKRKKKNPDDPKQKPGPKHREKLPPASVCEICGVLVKRENQERHRNDHLGHLPYACTIEGCSHRFSSKASLQGHLARHADRDNVYECDICGTRIKTKSSLHRHRKLHTSEKPHACDICGKRFWRKAYLTHHATVHTGVAEYPCEYCGFVFKNKYWRSFHVKKKHLSKGEAPKEQEEAPSNGDADVAAVQDSIDRM